MVVKVNLYFDVPGKFSVDESNEIIRDLRKLISGYFQQVLKGPISGTLSNGKKVEMTFLSEDAARKILGQQLKVSNKSLLSNQKTIEEQRKTLGLPPLLPNLKKDL